MEEKQKKKNGNIPTCCEMYLINHVLRSICMNLGLLEGFFDVIIFGAPTKLLSLLKLKMSGEKVNFFFFCWISHFLFLEFKKGEGEIVIKLVGISFLIYSFNFIRVNFHARENNLK